MMAVLRHLIVSETASGGASVEVPVYGAVELTQTYRPLEARTLYRYADGSAALRAQWSGKLATEITGKGLIPPALSGLDYSNTIQIDCVAHRSVWSTGSDVTLPSGRRTDSEATPIARKWNGDTYTTATGTTASGTPNVLNITLASGESNDYYEVVYFPSLTCFASPPEETWVQNDGFSWSLRAEEA
jgi:hypothetical protein